MINKIISNKKIIAEVLSILAIALLSAEIIPLFKYEFKDVVFEFVSYATALVSAIWILVLLLSKKMDLTIKSLLFPTVFLFAGPLATNINNIMNNNPYANQWNYPFYIALYGAAIILFIILFLNRNKGIVYALYILFLIILTYNLLSVFNSSAIGLARLVIGLIIIGNVYLDLKQGEEKENEN